MHLHSTIKNIFEMFITLRAIWNRCSLIHIPRFLSKIAGLAKGGKKGTKKKIIDPFTRKDWYDVKAPSMFATRQVGKTLVNRTQGTRIASDGLKGRVFEVSLADLQNDNDAERSFRKFKLVAEDVQGRNVLTNFHGMDLTTDKLRWTTYCALT